MSQWVDRDTESKISEDKIAQIRWYWLAAARPTYNGLARACGISKMTCWRWRTRGAAEQLARQDTLYTRFYRELVECERLKNIELNAKKRDERRTAWFQQNPPPVPESIFYAEASLEDFIYGRVAFPHRSQAPKGLTYSKWPPETEKDFLKAKRAAWLTKGDPPEAWWKERFTSDPANWIRGAFFDENGNRTDGIRWLEGDYEPVRIKPGFIQPQERSENTVPLVVTHEDWRYER